MNYSILPPEQLFPPYNFQEELRPLRLKGALVEVRVMDDGARIERILSGSLKTFLDPSLAPGTVIKKGLLD